MLRWLRRTVALTRVGDGQWRELAPAEMCRTCGVKPCDFMGYCWDDAPESVEVYIGHRSLAPNRRPLAEIPRDA